VRRWGVSNTDQGGGELAELIRERAGGTCQEAGCEREDDLDVILTNQAENVSIDALELRCPEHRSQSLTESEVLDLLRESTLPFTTVNRVADAFSVSEATARRRLNDLKDAGEVKQEGISGEPYFIPDFRAASELIDGLREHLDLTELDGSQVEKWAREPYVVLPKGDGEYYIAVPRFVDLSLGHLHKQTESYNVFIVNRYIGWYSDLPDTIDEQVRLEPEFRDARVDGTELTLANEDEREEAWDELGGRDGGLLRREGDEKIRIQQGKEFEVISSLIDRGNLPFVPDEIPDSDLRGLPAGVDLYDHQQAAFEEWQEYGAIGVFWPPGSGKTYFSLAAADAVEGEKLVLVPNTTLKRQWESNIETVARDPDEWEVQTYQYLSTGDNITEYQGGDAQKTAIFDEIHHLPADEYSAAAMADFEYRIGLTASPYREDDREEYIFALSGKPVGVDWKDLVQRGVANFPDVFVYLYSTVRQKKQSAVELAQQKPGRGWVFSDSLDVGEEIAEELDVPFVHGEMPAEERERIIENETNNVIVISRVGDEGISVPGLDWIIEVDSLGASRQQEIQRGGRLLHSDWDEEDGDRTNAPDTHHIVLMTDNEYRKFHERLFVWEENGAEVQIERKR